MALLFSRPALVSADLPKQVLARIESPSATTHLERATPRSLTPPSANPHSAPLIPLRHSAALFDPNFASAKPVVAFGQTAALRAGWELRQQQTAIVDGSPAANSTAPVGQLASTAGAQIPQGNQTEVLTDLDGPDASGAVAPPEAAKSDMVASLEPDAGAIPLPIPRPAFSPVTNAPLLPSGGRRVTSAPPLPTTQPAAAPSQPGFFERLFSRPAQPRTAMAYAAPNDGGGGFAGFLSGRANTTYDKETAVYDISAHTVYLPNGVRLEAHSGLGNRLDDPRSVAEHMRGATPPNVYDLTLREAPFHGVRALRLTPVGGGETFGRGGLLAHTFMLGPRGDSNGCVVFRDYQSFLRAYESGAIKRLAVVARMG